MVGYQLDDEPNLYIGNGFFTKHLFINGCLGFQAHFTEVLICLAIAWTTKFRLAPSFLSAPIERVERREFGTFDLFFSKFLLFPGIPKKIRKICGDNGQTMGRNLWVFFFKQGVHCLGSYVRSGRNQLPWNFHIIGDKLINPSPDRGL